MLRLMAHSEDLRQHIKKHGITIVLGLLGNKDWNIRSSVHKTMSELVKYGMFQEQHDMLRLMMPSEDLQQHIKEHSIKTVLVLLSDEDWNVRSSALQTVSELVPYGMFQKQHDILRLMTCSENIRQHIKAHVIETVLGLLGDQDWRVRSSALNTMSELIKYGVF
jgi:HEAT repeat protein